MASVRVFDILALDALATRETPFGLVGTLYSDGQIEAVWVSKRAEAVDPGWFSQDAVDLIVVMQGRLRVDRHRAVRADRTPQMGSLVPDGDR